MTLKNKKNLFKAGAVIELILGICFCLSFIGILIGIFHIIAYSKFNTLANYSEETLDEAIEKNQEFGWSIFCLLTGTFLVFLPYVIATKHYIKADNFKQDLEQLQ